MQMKSSEQGKERVRRTSKVSQSVIVVAKLLRMYRQIEFELFLTQSLFISTC